MWVYLYSANNFTFSSTPLTSFLVEREYPPCVFPLSRRRTVCGSIDPINWFNFCYRLMFLQLSEIVVRLVCWIIDSREQEMEDRSGDNFTRCVRGYAISLRFNKIFFNNWQHLKIAWGVPCSRNRLQYLLKNYVTRIFLERSLNCLLYYVFSRSWMVGNECEKWIINSE